MRIKVVAVVLLFMVLGMLDGYFVGKQVADKWYEAHRVCQWFVYKDGALVGHCDNGCTMDKKP